MPEVLKDGPYRLYFWSKENDEPPHVHVRRDSSEAKFWLEPSVELADSVGYAAHELNRIRRLVLKNRRSILEKWHDHFDL